MVIIITVYILLGSINNKKGYSKGLESSFMMLMLVEAEILSDFN